MKKAINGKTLSGATVPELIEELKSRREVVEAIVWTRADLGEEFHFAVGRAASETQVDALARRVRDHAFLECVCDAAGRFMDEEARAIAECD